MSHAKDFKFKKTQEQAEAVALLHDLITSLKNGAIRLESGDEVIVLTPQGVMNVELEAKKKGDKESLCLEMSWSLEEEKERTELRISSELQEAVHE